MRRIQALFQSIRLALAVLATVLIASAAVLGQSGSNGTLTGVVQDPNGAHISGVTVTAKNIATGATRTATTSDDGRWSLPGLTVGAYEVTYEMTGFKKLVRTGVEVEASVPRTLEDKLEIGEIGAVINVMEGASLISAETSTVARQLSSEQLVQVPTSTRSFTQLLSAEAGVSTDLSPVLTNGNGNQSPSVNGTRTTSTSLFFNGIDATNITTNEGSLNDNIAPAPETLQEVKLQTRFTMHRPDDQAAATSNSSQSRAGTLLTAALTTICRTKSSTRTTSSSTRKASRGQKRDAMKPASRSAVRSSKIGSSSLAAINTQTRSPVSFPLREARRCCLRRCDTLRGARTADNLAAAFNLENGCTAGVNCLTAADISPVALRLFNLINPVTGDFVIPSPRAGARFIGVDRAGARAFQFGVGAG